ncbi:hypothetical protein LX16_3599 [Stackebrandtia albiflava]|uniref:DUF4350 domain-containing protein n=1 Tax=Stackebrandtia albiflava TaxID=406432 RepID=A0A562V4M8_9ACTN|nr:DUF4350 domain-containing protein [Stackebrandtia albiflava]TWJ12833.1 hypothetical protein LX16_3599 [Stackebrandtia albiflava]
MTAVAEPDVKRPEEPTTPRPRFDRRRMAIPLLVALVLIVFTVVAALVESPDPSDPAYLSPESAQPDGGSVLAGELAAAGVTVERFTDATEGLAAAGDGTTVFLPAPAFLNTDQLYQLGDLVLTASDVTIVMVDPPRNQITPLGLDTSGGARIATRRLAPECDALATTAEADVGRQAYRPSETVAGAGEQWSLCFDGYLARAELTGLDVTVVGAGDPFGNAGMALPGNRTLALELLAGHDRLVWIDVHALATPAPAPQPSDYPDVEAPEPPPSVPIRWPEAGPTNPLYDAMPQWLWAGLVGLLVLGVMAALWRGRRLGPPVAEPLPASVPSAETVHGRARLYRRAYAYPQALRALRAGALRRIRPVLGLSSQADEATVVSRTAAHCGWSEPDVAAVLFRSEPRSEAELFHARHTLDALVAAVENSRPQGRDE